MAKKNPQTFTLEQQITIKLSQNTNEYHNFLLTKFDPAQRSISGCFTEELSCLHRNLRTKCPICTKQRHDLYRKYTNEDDVIVCGFDQSENLYHSENRTMHIRVASEVPRKSGRSTEDREANGRTWKVHARSDYGNTLRAITAVKRELSERSDHVTEVPTIIDIARGEVTRK